MQPWYRFKPVPFSPNEIVGEAKEELLALYKRAVKRQLLSDVPVGLLLSGGVDSGLLLGLMNLNGAAWPTYTVGYGSSFADDELADAAETAADSGIEAHRRVTLTRSTFEEALPKIVACLEEPIASSSIVPMYFVCRASPPGREGGFDGTGTGRIVRRLSASSRRAVRQRCGQSLPDWMRGVISSVIGALPRNETLKRGVYSLAIPDRMRRYQHVLSLDAGRARSMGCSSDGLLASDTGDTDSGLLVRIWPT